MAQLIVPLPVDEPRFTMRTTLDGRDYGLRFDYSDAEGRWYFALLRADDTAIRRGIKVVPGYDLLDQCAYRTGAPPGKLIFFGRTPALSELHRRCFLVYIPEADLEGLPAS